MLTEKEARAGAEIRKEPRMLLPDGSRAPETWELRLPEGWRFRGEEVHALVCFSRAEAETARRRQPIEPCPADCSCREES